MKHIYQIIVFLAIFFFYATVAFATEFFCPSGNVTCLIAAINEANLSAGPHTINLEPEVYTLRTRVEGDYALPWIRTDITINGLNATIDGDRNCVFFIRPGARLRLYGFWLQNMSTQLCTPIWNVGTLDIEFLSIRRNQGVPQAPYLIVSDSPARIFRTEITENTGLTLIEGAGDIVINRVSIYGNDSPFGLIEGYGGRVQIIDSDIYQNTVDVRPPITLHSGEMTIVSSSIIDNRWYGAVLGNGGRLRVLNSTIARNVVAGDSPTISGGIINRAESVPVELQNTILGNNVQVGEPQDCRGVITSLGNNIIGDTRNCDFRSEATDIVGYGGLGEFTYGGEFGAQGHFPLLSDSPAIDSANPDACPEFDQLGNPRVGTCDRGAVEFQGEVPAEEPPPEEPVV